MASHRRDAERQAEAHVAASAAKHSERVTARVGRFRAAIRAEKAVLAMASQLDSEGSDWHCERWAAPVLEPACLRPAAYVVPRARGTPPPRLT